MLHLPFLIHVSDNEMYTCKDFCLFDNFSHPTISVIGIQGSDLKNTSHGKRKECYI